MLSDKYKAHERFPKNPEHTIFEVLLHIAEMDGTEDRGISVYDISEHFKIDRNDATVRLKKLFKWGYLQKVAPGTEGAEACSERVKKKEYYIVKDAKGNDKKARRPGRKAFIYMLTDSGREYAKKVTKEGPKK